MRAAFSSPACILLLAAVAQPAAAASREEQILKLAPSARIEQRCNAKAMGTINREHKDLRPDELVAYAFADTKIRDGLIEAPGAAVRSGGKWYHLSYTCQTTNNGTAVESFDYVLGTVVPRPQWAEHYLVP
ncbi:DUF930 domain-containing protein [Azorhizobium doebereinerae]|uniref:DUF930 domain-containing protein n=1 Tax=Azorhizobium doebereinerae TaxID=281091 RepID=UPI00041D2D9F|nr:DUF930 domain-containing protein [Azorhizobium doebereinerae]